MKTRWIIILVILAVLIPTGVILASNLLNAPLDPPLELEVPTEVVEAVVLDEAEPAPAEQDSQPEGPCGNKGVMRIFQVGVASPLEEGHVGADSVRLIVVDFDAVTAEILALPADLWIDVPDDLVDEVDHFAPINLIYLAAYETATGNDEKVRTRKATEMLAQAILDEFEFVPDKYINVNGDAFIQLVDIFEVDGEKGIQIDLTGYGPVNGDPEGHGYFPGEVQILDGQDTLDFVRILYPDGVGPDYAGRFERQKIVILALMDAILNFDELDKVDDLLKEARKMVITDLSVDQVRDLACMVEAVDGEAEFIEVSTEEVTVVTTEVIDGVTTEVAEEKSLAYFDGEDRLVPDVEAIKAIIQEMGSGPPE